MLIRATRVGGTWEQAQHHPKEHLGQELLVWVQESGGAGVSWRGHPCPCPQPHPWWVLMGHSPQLKAINPPGYRQGFLAPWLFLGQDRAGGALGGELGTNKNHTPKKPTNQTKNPTPKIPYVVLCFSGVFGSGEGLCVFWSCFMQHAECFLCYCKCLIA